MRSGSRSSSLNQATASGCVKSIIATGGCQPPQTSTIYVSPCGFLRKYPLASPSVYRVPAPPPPPPPPPHPPPPPPPTPAPPPPPPPHPPPSPPPPPHSPTPPPPLSPRKPPPANPPP